jgi:hypothetical protein
MKKREMTQDDLDQLFQNILAQPPIINEEQVNSLLYSSPKAPSGSPARHFIKNHLNFLIMSTIVSSIIIGALLWTNAPKHKATQKEDVINQAKSQTTNTITASPKSHFSNTIAALPKSKDSKAKPQNLLENPKIGDSTQSSFQNASIMDNQPVIEADSATEENILSFNVSTNNSPEHHWPADTVLDGKTLFVTLTDEELMKLGIKVTKGVIRYCNKNYDGSHVNINYSPFENIDTTYNSFSYCFSCGLDFDKHYGIDLKKYHTMDTLLPLKFVEYKRHPSDTSIWWFTTNHELFNALPERYKNLELKYEELKWLKKKNPNKIFVDYFNLNKNLKRFQNINFIMLNNEELMNLGIELIHDTVSYEKIKSEFTSMRYHSDNARVERNILQVPIYNYKYLLKSHSYLITETNGKTSTGSSYGWGPLRKFKQKKISSPIFATDTFGRNIGPKIYLENTSIDYTTLIPILIFVNECDSPDKIFRKEWKYIFWYEPDTAFINRLPKSIASVLKPEYDAIVKSGGTSSQSCTYFEVCQSTLTLNRLDVYPNPAQHKVTIAFNAPEDLTGKISLVDIRGSEVKVLQSQTRFAKGENKFQADVSDVSAGIFLIYINTNKGFRTQRIVVTK